MLGGESQDRLNALRQKMAAEAQAVGASAEDEFERRVLHEVRGIARLLKDLEHVSTIRLHDGLLLVQYVGARVSPCLYVDHGTVRVLSGQADWLHVLDNLQDVDAYIRTNFELPSGGEIVTMPRVEKHVLVRAS